MRRFDHRSKLAMFLFFSNMMLLYCSCGKNNSPASPPDNANKPKFRVTTFAGNGSAGLVDGDGPSAEFFHPFGITVDSLGNVYLADEGNNCIRKITPAGSVSTLAGTGIAGYQDGPGNLAMFNSPDGVLMDYKGNIFVADTYNDCIRKISPSGMVSTFAGQPGVEGYLDSSGSNSLFAQPTGIAIDYSGALYIADAANECIRRIDQNAYVSTVAGKPGNPGFADGAGSTALFDNPQGCAVNILGDILVADVNNNRIRYIRYTIYSGGTTSTLAGNSKEGYANGTGAAAQFAGPTGVCIGFNTHDTYVADSVGQSIRLVSENGDVSLNAGDPLLPGYADRTDSSARFSSPTGIAVDNRGNIYVADYINNRIRKITRLN